MIGEAFVLEMKPEVYTAENGKEYEYSTVKFVPYKSDGTLAEVVTCSALADCAFQGMGKYSVEIELRMRNMRATFRVLTMDLVSAVS